MPELGFTGQKDDLELGVTNLRGRMYDFRLGRFLSADPLVQKPTCSQSLNRCAYVWNNPLTMTDPSGFGAAEGPPEGGGAPEPTTPTGKADDDFYDSLGDGGATGGGGSGVVDCAPTAMGGDAGPITAEGTIPPSGSVTRGGSPSDPGHAQGITGPFSIEIGNGDPNNDRRKTSRGNDGSVRSGRERARTRERSDARGLTRDRSRRKLTASRTQRDTEGFEGPARSLPSFSGRTTWSVPQPRAVVRFFSNPWSQFRRILMAANTPSSRPGGGEGTTSPQAFVNGILGRQGHGFCVLCVTIRRYAYTTDVPSDSGGS